MKITTISYGHVDDVDRRLNDEVARMVGYRLAHVVPICDELQGRTTKLMLIWEARER